MSARALRETPLWGGAAGSVNFLHRQRISKHVYFGLIQSIVFRTRHDLSAQSGTFDRGRGHAARLFCRHRRQPRSRAPAWWTPLLTIVFE